MVEISVGLLLWFEKRLPLGEAVCRAIQAHQAKFGVPPEYCYAALEWGLVESMVISGALVVPERSVMKQHLYVGRKDHYASAISPIPKQIHQLHQQNLPHDEVAKNAALNKIRN